MSKPWEADDDFVMYLKSGDRGTHPLEPDDCTFSLPTGVRDSLVPIARLASGLAQYVLHPLVRKCGVEIAHRFPLSSGMCSVTYVV